MKKVSKSYLPTHVLSGCFTDLDSYSQAVQGWDLDFMQLDRGALNAELFQANVGPVLLGRYSFSRRFNQFGASPAGVRTFGFVDGPGVTWCGRVVEPDTLFVFPVDNDYKSISPPGFIAKTISVSEEHLNVISQSLGIPPIGELAGQDDFVVRCDHQSVESLRRRFENLYRSIHNTPALLNQTALQKEINWDLPANLLQVINAFIQKQDRLPTRRQEVIQKVQNFIFERECDVTIAEICQVSGVSWRTLDYAFNEHIGVNPKNYLQAVRLNHVYRKLSQASAQTKISDIANLWGFWHLGQFAKDYRTFFGELPSDTVRRSSGS